MPGDEAVCAIEDRRRNPFEDASRELGALDRLQEAHDAGSVTDNRAVSEDEPPGCRLLARRERGEKRLGSGVFERKERQLLSPVE